MSTSRLDDERVLPELSCFKAYDVRGRVPDELNEELAWRIGRAYAEVLDARRVIVGRDVRLSSEAIAGALMDGLREQGADVHDIGLAGTEEVYFATGHTGMDGGIVVTASHNPMDYNGMKFVRAGAQPISGDSGLNEIRDRARQGGFCAPQRRGVLHRLDNDAAYVQHLLGYVNLAVQKPLRIVTDAGNGGAGRIIDLLEPHLPYEFITLNHTPDGHFPNGVPNPLLPENRGITAAAVREHGADFGIAWDGDFDRCFFFDSRGGFIEGYYLVGLLAEAFLREHPGESIVHDPRLTWNTRETVTRCGGRAVQSKTGHAFIKERMRRENAIYGGEMSAHHYFRDFYYCDSGMIPWLLVAGLVSERGESLDSLVAQCMAAYPCSGEINRRVADSAALLAAAEARYSDGAETVEHVDGLSVAYPRWRFNLRCSNTEPVVRLNVESRGDAALMAAKRDELLALIDAF
jgi:phosphomannomutase